MHFGRPDNLYFLLLLVPMAVAFGGFLWWKRRVRERIGHFQLVNEMASAHSPARQVTRAILVMMAFALICLACARPQWGQDDRTIKRFGVDVVFALDLSKSMLAQDIPPSRLNAAKKEISGILKSLQGDRVGLVVFTAVSFAQSPLTADYGAIDFYLDKLTPRQMPMGGTALAPAMLDSIKLLTGKEVHIGPARTRDAAQQVPEADHIKRAKNQVIVLITDGEDHESAPLKAAQVAKQHGIHVVTVGIGSTQGSRIPIFDEHDNLTGYKRDQRGELIQSALDETTLQKVAAETGGTYVHYNGKNSVVNGVTQFINHLEKTELETMLRENYKDRFVLFLAPALLLLLLALLLGERRRGAGQLLARRGCEETDKPASKKSKKTGARQSATLLILLVLLVPSVGLMGCDDTFRNTLGTVDEANELISQNEYAKALEKYQEAETEIPANAELHYNLGIALLGEKKYDEARQAFARALATQDPELRFDSLFNMGLTLARQEQWKEAYDTYKQALQVNLGPAKEVNTERVKQAQHNLEVVFRKLFPPCAELEDDSEANDDPSSAADLDKLEKKERTLCGLNDDWYKLPIIPGSKVSVKATFSQLRDEPDPEHIFLTRPEDLQLSIFDARGEKAVGVDQGSHDDFDPKRTRATREIADLRVTPEMLPGDTDQLLIKLAAGEYREFSYDLEVTAIPPCHALEDDFEPNNDANAAAAIDTGSHDLHLCPGNDDWFRVEMELGDSLFVDLQAGEDVEREKPANLSVRILRADTGEVVATERLEPPFLTAGIQDVAKPGTYLIHIGGQTDDEQGPYRADVYHYAPCVIGNDRFEPNDSAQAAADVDPNAEHLRYLRLCADDRDYFKLPAPEPADADDSDASKTAPAPNPQAPAAPQGGKKEDLISWALTRVGDAPEKPATPGDAPVALALDLLSLSGNQVIAEGITPETPDALGPLSPDAPEIALLPDQIVHYDNAQKEQLLLRAQGPATFYHLRQLNPQNQNQDEQENQDEQQDENEEKNEDQDQNEDSEQDGDNEDESDEEDKDESSDESDKDEESSEDDDSKDSEDKEQDDAAEDSEEEAMTPEERRMDDILRALEESDDNFQMKKALENMPRRHIEKDW